MKNKYVTGGAFVCRYFFLNIIYPCVILSAIGEGLQNVALDFPFHI